jgi:hypothetical protein
VAVVGLACVGAAVLCVGLLLRVGDADAAYRELAPDTAAGVGTTLLALAYLPNAVIAAAAWALGPGVSVGVASASPFAVTAGEPSMFPLLTALPVAPPPNWAPAVIVLPVLVGVLCGLMCRRTAGASERVRAAVGAAVLAAGAVGLLGLLAGGRLATGAHDPVRLPVELLVPAVLLCVGVPAVLVAVVRRAGRVPADVADVADVPDAANAAEGSPAQVPAQRGARTVAELIEQRAREAAAQEPGEDDAGEAAEDANQPPSDDADEPPSKPSSEEEDEPASEPQEDGVEGRRATDGT